MRIAAIMPCRGRKDQTLRNVRRLLATAGLDHGRDWTLYLSSGAEDSGMITDIARETASAGPSIVIATSTAPRLSYWQALQQVTERAECTHLIGLANDLLPGHKWLQRAAEAYRGAFGDGDGLIGLNDGIHEVGLSPHFLISRGLLDRFGGWPVWYDHNFGDAELCERAIGLGLYGKAPWAVLYHDHFITGNAVDQVYQEGGAQSERDRRLFLQRKAASWPAINP